MIPWILTDIYRSRYFDQSLMRINLILSRPAPELEGIALIAASTQSESILRASDAMLDGSSGMFKSEGACGCLLCSAWMVSDEWVEKVSSEVKSLGAARMSPSAHLPMTCLARFVFVEWCWVMVSVNRRGYYNNGVAWWIVSNLLMDACCYRSSLSFGTGGCSQDTIGEGHQIPPRMRRGTVQSHFYSWG